MKTLYEIEDAVKDLLIEARAIETEIEEAGGEVDPAMESRYDRVMEALDNALGEGEEKIERYVMVWRNLMAEAEIEDLRTKQYSREASRFRARKNQIQRQVDNMKCRAGRAMHRFGVGIGKKHNGEKVSFAVYRSSRPSVEIFDHARIPNTHKGVRLVLDGRVGEDVLRWIASRWNLAHPEDELGLEDLANEIRGSDGVNEIEVSVDTTSVLAELRENGDDPKTVGRHVLDDYGVILEYTEYVRDW